MPAKGGGPRVRPQPQRTCVACRLVEGKRQLIRIVRTPAGEVEPDPSGKRSGRGAYVHGSAECIEKALSGGALSRALKVPVDAELKRRLAFQLLPQDGDSA